MNFIAVVMIIGLSLGALYYFNEPLFHTTMSKTGQAISSIKDTLKEKNISTEDIRDKLTYNTTEINGKTYYGMPYSEVPCQSDIDCEWFERGLLCDLGNGQCYK